MTRKTSPIMAVIGSQASGKTKVVEFLIANLTKEGLKIASLKHIHDADFTIDTQGTDSERYARAGAKIISTVAQKEITIIRKTETVQKDLGKILDLFWWEELDLIILEGFRSLIFNKNLPKIVTAKEKADLEGYIREATPPVLAISGLIAEKSTVFSEIPIIDYKREGQKLLQIVKNLLVTNNSISK
ncbi:MAG: molybdopterin-guanine dinucleotide biosynthesis protein B [Candidatus Bathyarchaeota archaeon]